MSDRMTDDELRIDLGLNASPLTGVTDTDQEWWIGPLSLSKHYPGFRVGWGHPLPLGAKFVKQWFDLDGHRGCAVLFVSMGTPPLYFTGWVPPEREGDADKWIAFLNDEIAKRHAGIDSREGRVESQEAEVDLEDSKRGRV